MLDISDEPQSFKVCIVGQSGAGKTSILNRYITGSFMTDYKPTISASFMASHEIIGDHTVTLNIWDTAGQEKFQSMMPLYLRNVDCVVLIFDILNPSSWDYVHKWILEQYDEIRPQPIVAVCANKCDCEGTFDIQVIENELKSGIGEVKTTLFFRTSALTGTNITTVFNSIANTLDSMLKKGKIQHTTTNPKDNSSHTCGC